MQQWRARYELQRPLKLRLFAGHSVLARSTIHWLLWSRPPSNVRGDFRQYDVVNVLGVSTLCDLNFRIGQTYCSQLVINDSGSSTWRGSVFSF